MLSRKEASASVRASADMYATPTYHILFRCIELTLLKA